MKVDRKNLVKKYLELFTELAENKENYKNFYEQFSKKYSTQNSWRLSKLEEAFKAIARLHTRFCGWDGLSQRLQFQSEDNKRHIHFITPETKDQVTNSAFVYGFKWSIRLSPLMSIVSNSAYGWTANRERTMKAQAFRDSLTAAKDSWR